MIKKKAELKNIDDPKQVDGLAKKVIGNAFDVSTKEHGGTLPFSKDRNTKDRPLRNSPRVFPGLKNASEVNIDLIDIDVVNIRNNLNEYGFLKVKQSISQNGLLQPIIVYQKNDGRYSLKYGNTRLRACKELGWKEIPVYITDAANSESEVILQQLAENNDRNDLSPLNVSEAIERIKLQLKAEGKTCRQEDLAAATGYTLDQIKKYSRILKIKDMPELYRLIKEIELYGYSKSLFEALFEEFKEKEKSASSHFSENELLSAFFEMTDDTNFERCKGIHNNHLHDILLAENQKSASSHFFPAEAAFWKHYGKYCSEIDKKQLGLLEDENKKDEKAIKATEALQKYMKTILKTVKNIKNDIDKIDSSQISVEKLSIGKIQELQSGNSEFAEALIDFDKIFAERNIDLGLTKQFFEKGLESLDPQYVAKMVSKWTQAK
jgi:ParB/RepB/Spo0J family partition protein